MILSAPFSAIGVFVLKYKLLWRINFSSYPLDVLSSTLSDLLSLGMISRYVNSAFFITSRCDTDNLFGRRKMVQSSKLPSIFSSKGLAPAPSSCFLDYLFFILIKLAILFLFLREFSLHQHHIFVPQPCY